LDIEKNSESIVRRISSIRDSLFLWESEEEGRSAFRKQSEKAVKADRKWREKYKEIQ